MDMFTTIKDVSKTIPPMVRRILKQHDWQTMFPVGLIDFDTNFWDDYKVAARGAFPKGYGPGYTCWGLHGWNVRTDPRITDALVRERAMPGWVRDDGPNLVASYTIHAFDNFLYEASKPGASPDEAWTVYLQRIAFAERTYDEGMNKEWVRQQSDARTGTDKRVRSRHRR
jgi:hypothetical protein